MTLNGIAIRIMGPRVVRVTCGDFPQVNLRSSMADPCKTNTAHLRFFACLNDGWTGGYDWGSNVSACINCTLRNLCHRQREHFNIATETGVKNLANRKVQACDLSKQEPMRPQQVQRLGKTLAVKLNKGGADLPALACTSTFPLVSSSAGLRY